MTENAVHNRRRSEFVVKDRYKKRNQTENTPSIICAGSHKNFRHFDDNASWSSLQSTIISGSHELYIDSATSDEDESAEEQIETSDEPSKSNSNSDIIPENKQIVSKLRQFYEYRFTKFNDNQSNISHKRNVFTEKIKSGDSGLESEQDLSEKKYKTHSALAGTSAGCTPKLRKSKSGDGRAADNSRRHIKGNISCSSKSHVCWTDWRNNSISYISDEEASFEISSTSRRSSSLSDLRSELLNYEADDEISLHDTKSSLKNFPYNCKCTSQCTESYDNLLHEASTIPNEFYKDIMNSFKKNKSGQEENLAKSVTGNKSQCPKNVSKSVTKNKSHCNKSPKRNNDENVPVLKVPQSTKKTRRSCGVVVSPLKPVCQIRKMFSPGFAKKKVNNDFLKPTAVPRIVVDSSSPVAEKELTYKKAREHLRHVNSKEYFKK